MYTGGITLHLLKLTLEPHRLVHHLFAWNLNADRNHPIASSPDKSKSKPQEINNDGLPETPNEDPQGDPPKPKKGRSKERIFLPGGHDMRLTAQVEDYI